MHRCVLCLYQPDVYIPLFFLSTTRADSWQPNRMYARDHAGTTWIAKAGGPRISNDDIQVTWSYNKRHPNTMLLDFTEVFKQTGQLAVFSPGTTYLLTAVQDRLVVRRTGSFQVARTWLVDTSPSTTASIVSPPPRGGSSRTLRSSTQAQVESETTPDGWITHVGWSCDSEYVLACCAKRGVVNVYKMVDEQWNARIEAGAEGLARAEWAPDGRSIVCFSEWGVSEFS
jgi:hypothetical protein